MILITGYDDTFGQVVHSRYSYIYNEIVWGGKFEHPYYFDDNGDVTMDSDLIDKYKDVNFIGF